VKTKELMEVRCSSSTESISTRKDGLHGNC